MEDFKKQFVNMNLRYVIGMALLRLACDLHVTSM